MALEIYAESQCVVAESPRWNAEDKALYWVDVTAGEYLRRRDGVPVSAVERVNPQLGKIGALICTGPSRLRLFTAGCRIYDCEFGGTPLLAAELPEHEDRRFNDVLMDDSKTEIERISEVENICNDEYTSTGEYCRTFINRYELVPSDYDHIEGHEEFFSALKLLEKIEAKDNKSLPGAGYG